MYGYPEQFIPAPELIGVAPAGSALAAGSSALATSKEVPA
jgi:Amt family ammonium transporter